jgi:hypothetical protein
MSVLKILRPLATLLSEAGIKADNEVNTKGILVSLKSSRNKLMHTGCHHHAQLVLQNTKGIAGVGTQLVEPSYSLARC